MSDWYEKIPRWKYRTTRIMIIQTDILGYYIRTKFTNLTPEGTLTVGVGYCWDGPSGPTWDTKTGQRGSLFHDDLYQLLRMGLISQSNRIKADRLFYRCLIEDGMKPLRARYWYLGVRTRIAGASARVQKRVGDE